MVSIREQLEQREEAWLASRATLACDATRSTPEEPCDLRTDFQRDRDRIIHSKAFRRLKYKTQVFLSPAGDHVRTRLTHTLEVTQVARTISRALRLNEDLTEAIALGHDLGHTPFGHSGERALARAFPGFRHNEQSLRIIDLLEKGGQGLNLTDQTREGILRHSKPRESIVGDIAGIPETAEAQVVKIADGIAYVNHDLDDAIRSRMLSESDLPAVVVKRLGATHSERINTLVADVVQQSAPLVDSSSTSPKMIRMSPYILEAANVLRDFLFERVYQPINDRPATRHAEQIVLALFDYYVESPDSLPTTIAPALDGESVHRRVADVVCGMTDRYAVQCYESLFMRQTEEV